MENIKRRNAGLKMEDALDKIKKEICDKNGIRLIYYVRIKKYQTNSLNEIHEPSKIVNLI